MKTLLEGSTAIDGIAIFLAGGPGIPCLHSCAGVEVGRRTEADVFLEG